MKAVILAGGRRKDYLKKDNWLYKILVGRIIPGEEKAVMRYKGEPMVKHVLYALSNSKNIDDIVLVGNSELLKKAGVNGVEVLEQAGTALENAMVGYEYFKERGYNGKILIAPCDIPEIKGTSIDEFVEKAAEGDFCLAVGDKEFLGKYDGIFRRFYLWILKNGERKKYRLSNLCIVNPGSIKNKEMVEYAFELRKIMNPPNLLKIFRETGLEPFFYWATLKLSVEYLEAKISEKVGCDFRTVEISDPAASFDLDHRSDSRNLRKWYKLEKIKA